MAEAQGGVVECRTDGAKLPAGNRAAYVGTATLEDIDAAGHILLIGSNPRDEAPVLNARIRQAWSRGATVGRVGPMVDLTYPVVHLGEDRKALEDLLSQDQGGQDGGVIVIGQGALQASDGAAVLATAQKLAEMGNAKLLVLHTAAGRVGAMDVGAVNDDAMMAADGADVIYSLGADEVDIAAGAFVIYQGSHGDRGAHRADVILPGAAYTEENGLFVNTEGRPQLAMRAGFAPGEAKENWAILRALSAELDATLPWDSLAQLRQALIEAVPHLRDIDVVPDNEGPVLAKGRMNKGAFAYAISDFYLTNPIARASSLMAELSANAKARATGALAAE